MNIPRVHTLPSLIFHTSRLGVGLRLAPVCPDDGTERHTRGYIECRYCTHISGDVGTLRAKCLSLTFYCSGRNRSNAARTERQIE